MEIASPGASGSRRRVRALLLVALVLAALLPAIRGVLHGKPGTVGATSPAAAEPATAAAGQDLASLGWPAPAGKARLGALLFVLGSVCLLALRPARSAARPAERRPPPR